MSDFVWTERHSVPYCHPQTTPNDNIPIYSFLFSFFFPFVTTRKKRDKAREREREKGRMPQAHCAKGSPSAHAVHSWPFFFLCHLNQDKKRKKRKERDQAAALQRADWARAASKRAIVAAGCACILPLDHVGPLLPRASLCFGWPFRVADGPASYRGAWPAFGRASVPGSGRRARHLPRPPTGNLQRRRGAACWDTAGRVR
nr:hypothetical protein [Pandoravirus aubagnensis]